MFSRLSHLKAKLSSFKPLLSRRFLQSAATHHFIKAVPSKVTCPLSTSLAIRRFATANEKKVQVPLPQQKYTPSAMTIKPMERNLLPKISITHVKQKHNEDQLLAVSFAGQQNRDEEVAYSQYQVARAILNNPDKIVLVEGASENYTPARKYQKLKFLNSASHIFSESIVDYFSGISSVAVKDELDLFKHIKKVFAKGFPDTFSEMNDEQKSTISQIGGPLTLFYLDKLSDIYKTTTLKETNEMLAKILHGSEATSNNNELYAKWMKPELTQNDIHKIAVDVVGTSKDYAKLSLFFSKVMKPEIYAEIFEKREKAVFHYARAAAIASGNPNILLVYGGGHDFEKRIKQLNDPQVEYKGSIETGYIEEKSRRARPV